MNTSTRSRHGRRARGANQHRSASTRPSSGKRHGGRPGHSRSGAHNNNRRGGSRGGRKQTTFDPSQFINTNPVDAAPEVYAPTNRFDTFGLDKRLASTLAARKLTIPTPIQDQIIPEIMNGNDVVGLAETGTGKTAAFLLPLVTKTLRDPSRQTLILAPTRELAQQIEAELKTLTKGMRIFSVTCVGGININPQMRALRRHQNFVIGTPGRVLDLINRKAFAPANVTTVVLDEADRMLDMGFITDIRTILSATPQERETFLFSATMSPSAEKLVNDFLRDPVTVSVKKRDVTNSIKQNVVRFEHAAKFDTLLTLLSKPEFERILVFGSMKHSVQKLAKQLSAAGVPAEAIHGNKTQGQRQRALKQFKDGKVRVLVATDVAARGIHVDRVSHVINYDLPNTFDDYVHRIGRTGRGSERGEAITFVPTR